MSSPSSSKMDPSVAMWRSLEPFVLGGTSGMFATVCIQPLDMVKVRIQLQGEGGQGKVNANPLAVFRQIVATEGVSTLYTGLSAGLLRQATYTTTRLGVFRSITNYMDTRGPRTFVDNALAGLTAGGIGAVVGTPADLALIRMQADGTLPPNMRRNYKHVGDALLRIISEEGFMSMFKGCMPVVTRAMSLNIGMLAFHDEALKLLKPVTDNYALQHIGAKATAGFFASAFSLPFDFVKTRIQKQKPGPDGQLPYKNSFDCVSKTLTAEGPFAFYRGFWTYYIRIAPHVMITLFAMDGLQYLTRSMGY